MKRREFFKKINTTALAMLVSPSLLSETSKEIATGKQSDVYNLEDDVLKDIFHNGKEDNFLKVGIRCENMTKPGYKEYKDILIPRNFNNWTVKHNSAVNKKEIVFAQCTGGEYYIKYFQILTEDDEIIFEGTVDYRSILAEGVIMKFLIGSLNIIID